ncbi:MAG TPA: cell division protein FtsB [Nitrosomonas sp.]|mgnify:FL=1|nr:cell division protein FtsB [Nitrosomonas sp.]HQX13812.1 cell division protein FtsB [Nitrosomonas sp.]HRB21899.1 cell division protein FtsB [Nitrosomonas sp.]HRB33245.1 cell division protein FtsB [Nitrosomonas sp.]HRB45708.1 cell division protein FtsB [Nitrosomonas sp.]
MKLLALILFAIIALLQYPLWFSKSSWKRVWQVEEEVAEARQNNLKLQQRNNMLEAELSDLKQGLEAVEERARSDLGMVKQNEVLFQIVRIESQKQENQSPTHENNSSPKK